MNPGPTGHRRSDDAGIPTEESLQTATIYSHTHCVVTGAPDALVG